MYFDTVEKDTEKREEHGENVSKDPKEGVQTSTIEAHKKILEAHKSGIHYYNFTAASLLGDRSKRNSCESKCVGEFCATICVKTGR